MFFIKKILVILSLIFLVVIITKKDNSFIIPQDALRLRVLANSNSAEDQNIKKEVKDNLEKTIYPFLKKANSSEEAKLILRNNLDLIETSVTNTLNNEFNYGFNVNLGMNYFPQKTYKGVLYKAGDYESLVVTLGTGLGNNWWCVLFPPLCLIEAEESNIKDVQYKFFVKTMFDKYMK